MAAVSVIVPAHDAADLLPRCLDALAAQTFPRFEAIVVDDGSSDGTAEVAERHALAPKVVRLRGGAGAGAARAAGVQEAGGHLLAFTDSDCEPAPDWLAAGLTALEHADLVQGVTLPPPDAVVGPYDRILAVTREWGLYESANLFVRRDAYQRAGGFEGGQVEEETFRAAGREGVAAARPMGEDVAFGWRVRRAGGRTAFSDRALVHHAVFGRGAAEFVAERRRARHFPGLAREVPELRDEFFWGGVFLSARSAAFDLAVAGLAASLVTRRSSFAAVLPYAAYLAGDWRKWRSARVVAANVAADAVQAAALVRGSVAARTPVL